MSLRYRPLSSIRMSTRVFMKPASFSLVHCRYSTTPQAAAQSTEEALKKPMTVNEDLPDPFKGRTSRRLQFLTFIGLMGLSSFLIINYEKQSSPVVTTTLHFLRRSKVIRDVLGESIDFKSVYPWIKGTLNQVQGAVDITFDVKGSKNSGTISLIADREDRQSDFLIHQWVLTVDGKKYDLLEDKSVDFVVS